MVGLLLALASAAPAAIWPGEIDAYRQKTAGPADTSVLPELWKEYGFAEGETATYANGAKQLTATAWRFAESTGPMAAFYWQAPAGGTPIPLMKNGLAAKGVTLAAVGNYLVKFEGSYRPSASEIGFWVERFPGYTNRALPALPIYLPEGATSRRYITGPQGIAAFLPDLPVKTAAFEFGTEILVARYPTPSGELRVAVAGFANHAMARQQLPAFQQFAGEHAKRSGALVIVALPPVPADAAVVLDKLKYDSVVEYSDTVPTKMPNIAGLVLGSFRLVGALILVGLGSGGSVALFLFLRQRRRESGVSLDAMTRLNLD
ncbi:MAG: hypothetical protein K2X03_04890 [Bryobacteraceae bacterium]|nr:hypothetical protein [Bryobacteraceae bacterium]